MKRDRVSEILAVKERSGRRGFFIPFNWDLDRLKDLWSKQENEQDLLASLLPARIITLIEVFSRYWIQRLIDHGPPYSERASGLKADIKYDFGLIQSLQGQVVSLGLIISHSVSLSNIESIISVFDILLGEKFLPLVSQIKDRRAMETEGELAKPIIDDIDHIMRMLSRAFEIRHILVHEVPEKFPFGSREIEDIFDVSAKFLQATDEAFARCLYGLYPLTQAEMNTIASDDSEAAKNKLEEIVKRILSISPESEIDKAQTKWIEFSEAEATRIAALSMGGSMYSLIYHGALTRLTNNRISELQLELEEEEALRE